MTGNEVYEMFRRGEEMPEFGSFSEMQNFGKQPAPFVTPVEPLVGVGSIGVAPMGKIAPLKLELKLPKFIGASGESKPDDKPPRKFGGMDYLNSMFNYEEHTGQETPTMTNEEIATEMYDNSNIGAFGNFALRGVVLLGAIALVGLGLYFLFKEQINGIAKAVATGG